jgi:hypothetical protein
VVSTASAPDGRLLAAVRHPGDDVTPEEAVRRAEAAGEPIPVGFRVPVAACVLRVGPDFGLLNFKCLDAPHFRPREVVNQFWFGVTHYKARLVAFSGRTLDLPLMELAAFRYGIPARDYYLARDRYRGPIDLCDWFTNFGAAPPAGGLDTLTRLLGRPVRPRTPGEGAGLPEVNDGCLWDALDTYFVFLRTRVMTGDLSPEGEAERVAAATALLARRRTTCLPCGDISTPREDGRWRR